VGIRVDHGIARENCDIERGSKLLLDAERSPKGYLGDLQRIQNIVIGSMLIFYEQELGNLTFVLSEHKEKSQNVNKRTSGRAAV
jgi:hypothetical protein